MPEKETLDITALFSLTYGVYLVTSRHNDMKSGFICNTVIQVTSEPAKIAFAVNKDNYTHQCIEKSGKLAVTVLEKETPIEFIGRFGFKSGRDTDKFAGTSIREGVTGCPVVIENAVSVFEAKVTDSVDARKHTLFIAEVVAAERVKDAKPLTYAYYREVKKGKAAKNAPTFRGKFETTPASEETSKRKSPMKKYICDICAWEYDPEKGDPENDVPPGTAWEDVPDDWVCPVCGAPKDNFSPLA